jgi:hypothetical protein
MSKTEDLPVESFSAKISDLNHEQLGQVHRMLVKQQEQLVERSQALGRQIDDIRATRAKVAGQITKLGQDATFIGMRMKALEVGLDVANGAERAVGDLLRLDGEAPGVVLEARAKS